MYSKTAALLLALFLMTNTHLLSNEVIVVANPNIDLQQLSASDIKKIYSGKTVRTQNGTKIVPLEIKDKTVRATFYRQYLKKSLSQIKSYWSRLIFTGKGKPPRRVKDFDSLNELLKSHNHYISFVDSSSDTSGMKILYITDD